MSTLADDLFELLDSNAAFQSWSTKMHGLIVNAGWVQTADTGQVNVATAALPAANAYSGYRVYALADASQAAAPIFCKVEFGNGATTGRPQLRVAFGTGSSGAGALTNTSTVQTLTCSATGTSGVTRPGYACGLTGVAAVWTGQGVAADTIGFAVERWRDSDGVVTALGWTYLAYGPATVAEQTYRVGVGWRTATARFSCVSPVGTTAVEGPDVGLFPHIPVHGLGKRPGLMFVAHFAADIAAPSTFTASRYQVVRTYRAMGLAIAAWSPLGGTLVAQAMIYE